MNSFGCMSRGWTFSKTSYSEFLTGGSTWSPWLTWRIRLVKAPAWRVIMRGTLVPSPGIFLTREEAAARARELNARYGNQYVPAEVWDA